MSRHGLARSVFAVLLLWSMIVLLLPGDALAPSTTNDKLGHLLIFTALAVAGRWSRVPVLPLAGGLAAYAAATELLQAVLPINRHGDLRDLVADLGGVLAGLTLSWAVARWQRSRVPDSG